MSHQNPHTQLINIINRATQNKTNHMIFGIKYILLMNINSRFNFISQSLLPPKTYFIEHVLGLHNHQQSGRQTTIFHAKDDEWACEWPRDQIAQFHTDAVYAVFWSQATGIVWNGSNFDFIKQNAFRANMCERYCINTFSLVANRRVLYVRVFVSAEWALNTRV